jgi:hypothetical protein
LPLAAVVADDGDDTQMRLPKRYLRDLADPLIFYENEEFRMRFRFRKATVVQVLLPLVEDDLKKADNRGLPISPMFQLLLALRFYATASFQVGIVGSHWMQFQFGCYIMFLCTPLFSFPL